MNKDNVNKEKSLKINFDRDGYVPIPTKQQERLKSKDRKDKNGHN